MTNINEVFDKAVSSPSFFNPNSKDATSKENVRNVTGDFHGHMIEAEQRDVEFSRDGKTYKAMVFNYKFVVHKENAKNNAQLKISTVLNELLTKQDIVFAASAVSNVMAQIENISFNGRDGTNINIFDNIQQNVLGCFAH